jgi:uncharacterized protein
MAAVLKKIHLVFGENRINNQCSSVQKLHISGWISINDTDMDAMGFYLEKQFRPDTETLGPEDERRRLWRQRRSAMERRYHKSGRYALRRFFKFKIMVRLEHAFGYGLRAAGLYSQGRKNAMHIAVNTLDLHFSKLSASFDGYRVLHLTDLHLDMLNGTAALIYEKIKDLKVDLCVLTGDYRQRTYGKYRQILDPMKKILDAVSAEDGIVGTLGNHDPHVMAGDLEAMGMTLLVNETKIIKRGDEQIGVTGLDDPHDYYTCQAKEALAETPNGFKMALVHSPEMYHAAERNGYQLYLCGHTHGGQICLPGGYPIITHLRDGKKFARGSWQFNRMKGYTNQGCGVVGIPVRFNTQSEVALITLRRRRAGRPGKA